MKITPLCISCTLMKRSLELESLYGDEENNTRLSIMRELLEATGLYIGPDIEAAELATVSFRRLRSLAPRVVEMYRTLAASSMKMAVERAEEIRRTIEDKRLGDVLEFLLQTIAASTGYRPLAGHWRLLEEPPSQLDVVSAKKGRIDVEQFSRLVDEASSSSQPVYYLFASAHELPYDMLLVEKLVDEGVSVVGVVRGEPFEDYATAEDLDTVGATNYLEDVVEIEAAAAPLEEDSHIVSRMNNAPFVVVKGCVQSLYFHNNPLKTPMLLAFTAFCPVLVKIFQVPPGSVNAIVASPRGEGAGEAAGAAK